MSEASVHSGRVTFWEKIPESRVEQDHVTGQDLDYDKLADMAVPVRNGSLMAIDRASPQTIHHNGHPSHPIATCEWRGP